jgi:hypothetical protein
MSAAQIKKIHELTAELAKLSAEMLNPAPAPKPAVRKAAPSPTPNVKEVKEKPKRMTDAEFLAMGKELGKDTNGKVAGGKFPKATLPLYMGKVLSLPEVAEMLGVPVIRSDDPKQTHIYLDFSEPVEAKVKVEVVVNTAEVKEDAAEVKVDE